MRQLWQMWREAIPEEVVDRVIETAGDRECQTGIAVNKFEEDARGRSSSIRWISDQYWLRDQLYWYVVEANRLAFGIDVCNVAELQYTEYLGSHSGKYDWHHDVMWTSEKAFDRKISICVQLSNSDDYEGGHFEFSESENPTEFREKGSVLVFPSYATHRVTPVTKGIRKSLVAWFEGPRWR